MQLKFSFLLLIVALSSSCGLISNKKTQTVTKTPPPTQHQKLSYAIGKMVASDLKRNGVDSIDSEYYLKGINTVFNNDSSLLSEEEIQKTIQTFSEELQKKQESKKAEQAGPMIAQGKIFLEQNKSKEGVVTTASGLQYKITKPGTGAYPVATDKVKVHYEGKLLDGKIFDSSFERGEPIEFALNQVIPGWTEGMQHINEGGEIELYIPYNLAYGEQGAGGSIPPYSTLIFKVQLLTVSKAEMHNEHDGHNH